MTTATYMGEKPIVPAIGDFVMAPGNLRGIVIGVEGEFLKMLGILQKGTGETQVLDPLLIQDFLARECTYLRGRQILNS